MLFPREGGYVAADELRDEAIAVGIAARDGLLDVLAHGAPQMRRGALEALFVIAPEEGEARAIAIVAGDRDIEVREGAAGVLARCVSVASGEALVAATAIEQAEVVLAASRALAKRLDAFCTQYIEDAARAGTLSVRLVESLEREKRLAPLRILAESSPYSEAWSVAARALLRSDEGYDARRLLADPEIDLDVVRAATVNVLRDFSPAEAFEILAPSVTPGGKRTDVILWEVDDSLSDYSTGDTEKLIDPRWEARCRAIAGNHADGIGRGIRYYQLPKPALRAFQELSLPDDEENPLSEPYPLLVVGFEADHAWKAPEGSWMPTLYDVHHQSNGYRCTQVHLVGFVVKPPTALVALLEPLILESPTGWAGDLPDADLAAFTDAVRAALPGAPAMQWGLEAVVVSKPALDLGMLYGLPVIYFEPQCRPWDGPQFYGAPWPRLVEHAPFSAAHMDELRAADAIAQRHGIRLAVIWANSD